MYVEFLTSQKYNGVRYQPGEVVNFSKENVVAINYLATMQAMGRVLIHQELPERLSGATVRDAEKRPAPEPEPKKAKPVKKAAKKAPAKKAAPKKEDPAPEAKAPAKKASKRPLKKAKQVIKE